MNKRPILDSEKVSDRAIEVMRKFQSDTVREVQQATSESPIVVVGMAQNVFVKKARRTLEEAGVSFRYLEYGSYLSGWKKRLAVKLWSGWPTFPQVFIEGVLIGGASELKSLAEAGELKRYQK